MSRGFEYNYCIYLFYRNFKHTGRRGIGEAALADVLGRIPEHPGSDIVCVSARKARVPYCRIDIAALAHAYRETVEKRLAAGSDCAVAREDIILHIRALDINPEIRIAVDNRVIVEIEAFHRSEKIAGFIGDDE